MKTLLRLRTIFAALVALCFLSSCALPAPDAWRVIRNDGFFSYMSIELGRKPIPSGLSVSPRAVQLAQQQPTISVPWRATPNRYLETTPNKPVAGPPKVIAPKPSAPIVAAPKPVLRTLPPKPEVAKAPPAPASKPAVAPAAADKAELKTKSAPKIAAAPPAPAKSDRAPAPTTAPAPSPAANQPVVSAAINELPYGEVIAGRPGFVHSPFAMKTQIVDVTGLRPGQEVKCPFTGKLFRVPPGEQASAKPRDEEK